MKNLKKFSQKDRYGNMISFEFEVPPMENQVPKFEEYFNHPGQPQGTDTVPAWLTPGERVMNAEAERMYGPVLAQMNDEGRAIQAAQGGTIPNYGPEPEYAAGGCKVKYAAKGSKASCDCPECSRTVYAAEGDWITGNLLDQLRQVESGGDPNAVSPMGAIGPYQLMPATIADPGYGVQVPENFDPTNEAQSRAFAESYLKGIQAQYPDYTPQEVLAAYNAGPGRVAQYKAGEIPQLPEETQDYIGKFDIAMSAPDAPIVDAQGNVYPIDTLSASTAPPSPVKKEQSWLEWLTTPQEQTLSKTIDDSLGIDLGNDGIPKDEGRSELPPPKPTPAMQAIIDDKKGILHPLEGKSFIERIMTPRDEYITVTSSEEKAAAGMGGPEESDLQTIEPAIEASEGAEMPYFTTKEKALAKVKELDARTLDDDIGMQYGETSNDERSLYNQAKTWINQQTGDFNLGNTLEKVASSITSFIGDSGLLDSNELSRAAIMYLGSRAFGYDHGGSAQWAAQNYLKRIDAKEKHVNKLIESGNFTASSIKAYRKSGDASDLKKKTELKIGSDIKVGSVKLQDGSRVEVPVQFDSNSGRWGYYDNTNTFNPVSAGSVRDRQQPRTAEDTANAWRIMSKDWADSSSKVINNAINSKRKESLTEDGIYVLTGAEIAQQAESAFKDMGYDVFSPTQIREMPTIINQAIRNYSKNIEKYPEASFEPYLRQEIYKASLAGSEEALELFVLNPKETNLAKREPVSPRIVGRTFEQVESIAESFLSSQDKYKGKEIPLSAIQGKRNYYMRQAVIHYNSPEGKDLRNRYPGYETENGEKVSGVLQYVQAIMQDSKISDDEIGMANKNKATQ